MSDKPNRAAWEQAAKRLCGRFEQETRQSVQALDPWVRALKCMVTAWDNRACQFRTPRLKGNTRPPATWKSFCRQAALSVNEYVNRPGRGTWEYWAKGHSLMRCRYIPKRARTGRRQ